MRTGLKLAIAGVMLAGVTTYVAFLGASSSWQFYLSVDECVADASALVGRPLRVSGRVAADSLHIAEDRRQASFRLKGTHEVLRVVCDASLPDNLAEDMEVVVEGRLEHADLLRGQKVLTRCASKYEPKEQPPPPPPTARIRSKEGP